MKQKELKLSGNKLSKFFYEGRYILKKIDIELNSREIVGIAGENGSGKTTLLRMLSGLITPSEGKVQLFIDEKEEKKENYYKHIGFVAPYLNLYEEFTPVEHLKIFSQLRNRSFNLEQVEKMISDFHLLGRKDDLIRTFSSGMKQRVKYMIAILTEPEILFLDEPFTNLDADGIDIVRNLIEKQIDNNGSVIIASNDDREKSLCNRIIPLVKIA